MVLWYCLRSSEAMMVQQCSVTVFVVFVGLCCALLSSVVNLC